jgi:hypothetical protein
LTFDETDTGVGCRNAELLQSPLRRVSERGVQPFEATVELMHVSGRGYVLTMPSGIASDLPYLLTDDTSISLAYNGPILPEVDDKGIELATAIGDGMPVVGPDWLGVATFKSGRYYLTAFSANRWESVGRRGAYCPWWSESGVTSAATFSFSSPAESTE